MCNVALVVAQWAKIWAASALLYDLIIGWIFLVFSIFGILRFLEMCTLRSLTSPSRRLSLAYIIY